MNQQTNNYLKNWHRDASSVPVMPYNNLVSNQPMKTLLIVNLQVPSNTQYYNPNHIASFILGRRLDIYPMFAVSDDGTMKQIVLTSPDCYDIQEQVLEQLK